MLYAFLSSAPICLTARSSQLISMSRQSFP